MHGGFGKCLRGPLAPFKGKQSAVLDADQTVQEAVLIQVGEGRGRTESWLEVEDVVVDLDQIGVPIAREDPEVLNAAHFVGHEDPKALLRLRQGGNAIPVDSEEVVHEQAAPGFPVDGGGVHRPGAQGVLLHQRERPVFLPNHHVQVAVAVHVQKLGGGELPHVDGVACAHVGNGQGREHESGPFAFAGDVVEPVEQSEFVTHNDVEVSVAIEVSKGGVGAFNLEGGQRNPIVVHLVEARLIRGTDVAVRRHEGWGLVDALVPLLVGDGQVEQTVAVEIHQHRVGPTSHVDHVALEVGAVLKRPQRASSDPVFLNQCTPASSLVSRGVLGEKSKSLVPSRSTSRWNAAGNRGRLTAWSPHKLAGNCVSRNTALSNPALEDSITTPMVEG